jgi:hypothetical protein
LNFHAAPRPSFDVDCGPRVAPQSLLCQPDCASPIVPAFARESSFPWAYTFVTGKDKLQDRRIVTAVIC